MTPAPDQEPRQVLEYGRPSRPVSARRVFAGILGIVAGFCGCFSLLGVLPIANALLSEPNAPAVDRKGDMAEAVGLALIGVVLVVVSWRWCRFAFRKERDEQNP